MSVRLSRTLAVLSMAGLALSSIAGPGLAHAQAPQPALPPLLHVDSPSTTVTVGDGDQIDIGGWTDGSQVQVYLDGPMGAGQEIGSVPVDKARPDVAQVTGDPALANSGFDMTWTVANLTPGPHTLYVYADTGGSWATQAVQIDSSGATSADWSGCDGTPADIYSQCPDPETDQRHGRG